METARPSAVQEMWKRWDGEWDELETVIEEVMRERAEALEAARLRE